jgi:transposase
MATYKNAAGQEVRVAKAQRNQVMMHWHSLDQMIRPDHPARWVWRYVESLDLTAFYRDIRAVAGGVGRDAVDPKILLALWIFATIEGIASARRLADLCTRDFAYLWLCGEVTVNRDLLNDFRSQHPQALDAIMTETIGLLLQHDLVSLDCVAQDGMRVRASAGKSSFRRLSTLADHLRVARERVAQMRQQDDDDSAGRSRQEAARQRAAQERAARLEQAIEEGKKLQAQRQKQARNDGQEVRSSTTDSEARVMKMADGGFRPAYNVQFATTADTRLVVGVDVINNGSDSGQMQPMVERLADDFGRMPKEYLVDGGFSSRDDTTDLERLGMQVYGPVKCEQKLLAQGEDPYARRPGDTDQYYAFRQRMKSPAARELYQARASSAEFVNAGCRNRGLRQFLVRGQAKARTIAVWHALAHNLQMILYYGWLPQLMAR